MDAIHAAPALFGQQVSRIALETVPSSRLPKQYSHYTTIRITGAVRRTLLGSELMVSLRESKGASSLGDSRGCVTVNARDSSSRELGRALQVMHT
jgi:hypothetical protein